MEIRSHLPEICKICLAKNSVPMVGREEWRQYSPAGILLMGETLELTPLPCVQVPLVMGTKMHALPQKELPPGCPPQAHHRWPQSHASWASLYPGHFSHTSKNEGSSYQQCVKWVQTLVQVLHPVCLWLVLFMFHSWLKKIKSLHIREVLLNRQALSYVTFRC